MPETFMVSVLVEGDTAHEVLLDGPLDFGRQRAGGLPPYQIQPAAPGRIPCLVIAAQGTVDISRRHFGLAPFDGGRVRVMNHSKAPLRHDQESEPAIQPAGSAELAVPFVIDLVSRSVRVAAADSGDPHGIHSLGAPTRGPAEDWGLSLSANSLALLHPNQMRALLNGIPRALGVLQSAVGTADFLARAAHALVQSVGLDTGRVLVRQGDGWKTEAVSGAVLDAAWRPSRHVVERLRKTRSAVWQLPRPGSDPGSASLQLLDTVVAAPLLDGSRQIIGILYGERRKGSPRSGSADHRVEALLVDLLAGAVAAGLARMDQEKSALRATALLEQFFTPQLARHLAADPKLLDERESAVTVLFADVRSFSKYSERLGAAGTVRWINDVMTELSRCVLDE